MTETTARRTFVALAALALLAGPAAASLTPGQAAPDFALSGIDGKTYSLADQRGKVVVLEWINPNCPFSVRHADERTMIGLSDDNPEVVWLAINSTAESHRDYLQPAEHAAYNREKGIDYPVLYDASGKIGKAYDARTTPHMIVIDESGKVVYDGAIDDDPYGRSESRDNYVAGALADHSAGRAADPGTTKPYGCNVKYAD